MNAHSAALNGSRLPAELGTGSIFVEPALVRLEAFRRAQDHSRRVRVLKRVLPVCALLVAAGFGFLAYSSSQAAVRIEADSSTISNGQLVMADPKMEGFTREGRPYTVNAIRAIQDAGTQSKVQLDRIDAKLPVNKEGWISVSAPGGIYDREANTLTLDGGETDGIKVVSNDNTTVFMRTAVIDMKSGTIRAKNDVDITRKDGALSAGSATVTKDGKTLVFQDKVRMTLQPGQHGQKDDGNAKP